MELRRKSVTKMLLWEEYKRVNSDGYQLSRLYELYGEWAGKVDLVMRQDHRAGEKLFADYAGQTLPIMDRRTGEIRYDAQIFVTVMGASNYPYALVKKKVDIRETATTVEVLFKHNRIASHARGFLKGKHTTLPEHMPSSHRRYAEWTPERIRRWAATVGPETAGHVAAIMEHRTHPEQGVHAAFGIMRLFKQYGAQWLEIACKQASKYRLYSYKCVANILKTGAYR